MRRKWNRVLLERLFRASGLSSIEYFKRVIRRLERDVLGEMSEYDEKELKLDACM